MITARQIDNEYMNIRGYINSNKYNKETALKRIDAAINTAYQFLGKVNFPLDKHITRLTNLEEIIKNANETR